MRIILLGCLVFGLASCVVEPVEKQVETKELNGVTYFLVQKAGVGANGTTTIELWERKGITNVYYTPSLTGRDMFSVMR